VQYEEFLSKVQDRTGLARPGDARRAITATFSALCERISGGEASDLYHLLLLLIKREGSELC
jgi:uncharacterized protein (DUF2267 family)